MRSMVAKDPSFPHADSEESSLGALILLVLSCCGSYNSSGQKPSEQTVSSSLVLYLNSRYVHNSKNPKNLDT